MSIVNEEYENKIESESMCGRRISNANLMCRDCIYRFDDSQIYGNTSRCEKYKSKPYDIILNRERCKFYTAI